MTPQQRLKRYSQLAVGGVVIIWALLCFAILLSPRLKKLDRVRGDLENSAKQLAQMRREIEDARIAGGPPVGGARFEKFGILASDEEELFLSDLIDFCKETNNTLNFVRRAETSRRAPASAEEAQGGRQPGSSSQTGGSAADQTPRPIIEKVPHTVSFSGTFLSSFYLLRRLESYKRLLTVERAQMRSDTQAGYPRLNGDIMIELYLVQQPLPAVTASAGQAGAAQPAEAGSAGQ
jgi:hypothetical protein